MKTFRMHPSIAAVVFLLGGVNQAGHAASTDLADAPLATSSNTSVKPNLMFIFDASGSMSWDFLPDDIGNNSNTSSTNPSVNCKNSSGTIGTTCKPGDPPYYASEYNKIYYNPQITYSPGVKPHPTIVGGSVPVLSPQTNLSAVDEDAYDGSSSTVNLATGYTEVVFCRNSGLSQSTVNDSASYTGGSPQCKQNGPGYVVPTSTYQYRYTKTNSGPFYYDLTPKEYCSDESLVNCTLSGTPTGSYIYPAPVRYCKSDTFASSASAVTGSTSGSPRCQRKYAKGVHKYARYGTFNRVDIKSGSSYGNRPNRTDCATRPVCTYAEEALNFANWYAYYRTRHQMMKTSAGQAFIPIDDRYRVGFITINPTSGGSVTGSRYLKINDFDIAHKTNWYDKFYAQVQQGSTPLREALARVGRHFAGKTDGINSGMNDDPVQYSCQPNFAILTTDGYWNGNGGVKINGSAIGNQDNVDSGYTSRSLYGAYDGGLAGASDTLADVAAYYYKTDLRPAGSTNANGDPVDEDNVPTRSGDNNTKQHMVTFTLGLVDGLMMYRDDYYSATSGDFYKIKTASSGCSWASGTCNWPAPVNDSPSALDDLWHAAVNGFGRYYNATNPVTVSRGLQDALSEITSIDGAASAAATSSPNVTNTDNKIFSTTYRTAQWDGEIKRQSINMDGTIDTTVVWAASSLLNAKALATSDTRNIYTFDPNASNKLKPFLWADLTDGTAGTLDERAFFRNKGTLLQQYSTLSSANQNIANDGEQLVKYLRGQSGNEMTGSSGAFRDRDNVLGDTVSAKPAYVAGPRYNFADSGYSAFKSSNAARQAMLYVAANDGMLHAFNADTGQEEWAYVPRMLMPNLYKLATADYEVKHTYFVDGSPEVMDVQIGGTWKTILVGGLNKGGRGYYALDITDPLNPKALWEFCSDSTLCSNFDVNLGYSYGNPVITKNAAGNWVVLIASGYNNVSPGDGIGRMFTLDAATGAKISGATYSTGSGSSTSPSGLAKIAVWGNDANVDNTGLYAYGGDLNGDVWRFDLTATPLSPNPLKLAELKSNGSQSQPITTRPELGECNYRKMVFVGTGRYLGLTDLTNTQTQTVYGFKDELGSSSLGNLHISSNMVEQVLTTDAVTGTSRTITSNAVDLNAKTGWFVDLPTSGERVNIDPQLVLGTLLVASNVPFSNACTAGGDSWLYYFDYCTGSFVSTSTGAVVGNKVTGKTSVGFVVVSLPNGEIKQIVTDSRGGKTPYGVPIGGISSGAQRVGWRELLN